MPLFRSADYPVDIPATVPQPILLDESNIKLIGQIKKYNGVVAISVFNDERNILLMGDVDIEQLLKIARRMLATTRKISPLVELGSFVHMTLQNPEGNIIIAPYYDVYLCLFTTRTINVGHIRRILRELQVTKKSRNKVYRNGSNWFPENVTERQSFFVQIVPDRISRQDSLMSPKDQTIFTTSLGGSLSDTIPL